MFIDWIHKWIPLPVGIAIIEGSSENHRRDQEQIHHLFHCYCIETTRGMMSPNCKGVSHPRSGKKIRVRHDEVSVTVKWSTPKPQPHSAFVASQILGIRNLTAASWMLWLRVCDVAAVTQRFTGQRQVVSGPPQTASQEMCSLFSRQPPQRDRQRPRRQKSPFKKRLPSLIACARKWHPWWARTGWGRMAGGRGPRAVCRECVC